MLYGIEGVLAWTVDGTPIEIGPGEALCIPLKFLIIAAISFPLILVMYELLVRRFKAMRFFFGMRPKKKPPAARAANPAWAGG
jgi:hypothetical protein